MDSSSNSERAKNNIIATLAETHFINLLLILWDGSACVWDLDTAIWMGCGVVGPCCGGTYEANVSHTAWIVVRS